MSPFSPVGKMSVAQKNEGNILSEVRARTRDGGKVRKFAIANKCRSAFNQWQVAIKHSQTL